MIFTALLATGLALGNIPIADDLVDDGCAWYSGVVCAGEGTPANAGASASGPGFDLYLSDVTWDKAGVEPGTNAFSGVAFDVRIKITDEAALPGAGQIAYSAVCVNADGGISKMLDAGMASSVLTWDQTQPTNTLQTIAGQYASGEMYAYVEITDLCATTERRGVVAYVSWADGLGAYGAGGVPGWVDGNNKADKLEAALLGPLPSLIAPAWGEEGTLAWALLQTYTPAGPHSLTSSQMNANWPLVAEAKVYYKNGTQVSAWSIGTFASAFRNGSLIEGGALRTTTLLESRGGLDYVTLTVNGHTITWYPVGHPSRPIESDLEGWSSALAVSDALDAVNFIPGSSSSHLLDLEGMCQEWAECTSACDEAVGINPVPWLQCVFAFPWPFADVVGALRDDFMDSPAIASSRVIIQNLSTAYNAIGIIPEACGPLGTFGFGPVGGDHVVTTCSVPADWRGYARVALTLMIISAGLLVCVNMLLRAAGMATIGEAGSAWGEKSAAERASAPGPKMWGPGK